MTRASDIVAKLADADSRRIARWMSGRLRRAIHHAAWRLLQLRARASEAIVRTRRLPPGSLSASSLRDAATDDRFYLKQFRRHGPIFKLFWGSGHLKICVVGFPLARRLLATHRKVVRPETTDITSLVPAEYLRSMRPEIHPKYRRLLKGALGDDSGPAEEPELRAVIRHELTSLAADPTTQLPQSQRLYATLDTIALRALLLVTFGVRSGSEAAKVLEAAYRRMGPDGHIAPVGREQTSAFHAIRDVVDRILQSIQRDDPAGFADSLIARLMQSGSGTVLDETVIGNAIYMVERGHHDLRDLMRWILKYLSDDPSLIDELRAGSGNSKLAEACVLETLRLDQAEQLKRKAFESFDFEGFHVPKNSWVSILLRESHRDPRTFPDPDTFRPQRFLERNYGSDEYAPFGIDEHQCIGASFVRRTGTLFVDELVKGFRWSVVGDGPRHLGHFHWEPSPSFAIELVHNA